MKHFESNNNNKKKIIINDQNGILNEFEELRKNIDSRTYSQF